MYSLLFIINGLICKGQRWGAQGLVGVAEKRRGGGPAAIREKVGGINVEGTSSHLDHSAFLLDWALRYSIRNLFAV